MLTKMDATTSERIQLIFTRLTAPREFADHLYDLLSSDERARAASFRFENHHRRFIVARGLLRIALGKFLNVAAATVRFRYSEFGKPAIVDGPQIRFNVSHSEDMVLYGFGMDHDIGVDIEHIRPMEDSESIASRFFCAEECSDLLTVASDRRTKAFFDCWTRKEAFIKAIGEGLSFPLNRFQVTLHPEEPARFVSIDGRTDVQWSLHDVAPSEHYAAAVVTAGNNCRFVEIQKFETPQDCADSFA